MEKLRQTLKPVYKEFTQLYAPEKSIGVDLQQLPYEKLRYLLLLSLFPSGYEIFPNRLVRAVAGYFYYRIL